MQIEKGKVGDKVIVRSNEVGEPVVGQYTRDEDFGHSKVPIVVDEAGKELLCCGIIAKYNDELLEHLKKLSDTKDGWYFLCSILHPDSIDAEIYREKQKNGS